MTASRPGNQDLNTTGSDYSGSVVSMWRYAGLVLGVLAALHFLVDVVAGTTSPLWPGLERKLGLPNRGLLWVYVVWSISTSVCQLIFGWWADRWNTRWLVWAGPLVGILSINLVGYADAAWQLAVLFALGGLGIAAFHPEAAAMAGQSLPNHRSRAMAVFALVGYLGQAVGPYYSGRMTDAMGYEGLSYGIVWQLPILAVMTIAFIFVGKRVQVRGHTIASTGKIDIGLVTLLLAIGTFRILPALGVPLAIAYLFDSSDASTAVIGAVQSTFMAGIGGGAMCCAAFMKRDWERRVLIGFPVGAAVVLAPLSFVDGWGLITLVALAGVMLGTTMPVYIGYAQQLMPERPRVASAITMGASWGISGGIVAGAVWLLSQVDALPWIFSVFAVCSIVSSALSVLMPVPGNQESG